MYVMRQSMSNQTLCQRFGLPESKAATVSTLIGDAKDQGFIRADETESQSTRYARYIPAWA